VPPNDQTTFTIRFQPSDPNYKTAALSLPSDDLDEDPYNITLYGNYEPEINILEAPDGGSNVRHPIHADLARPEDGPYLDRQQRH